MLIFHTPWGERDLKPSCLAGFWGEVRDKSCTFWSWIGQNRTIQIWIFLTFNYNPSRILIKSQTWSTKKITKLHKEEFLNLVSNYTFYKHQSWNNDFKYYPENCSGNFWPTIALTYTRQTCQEEKMINQFWFSKKNTQFLSWFLSHRIALMLSMLSSKKHFTFGGTLPFQI